MFVWNFLGQALCTPCKEKTHQAKMFAMHDVLHISKCSGESRKWCMIHEENYIMFSESDKKMMCASCFSKAPNDTKLYCTDIDTAFQSILKTMDKTLNSIYELQKKADIGIIDLDSRLDQLKKNFHNEKTEVNTYIKVFIFDYSRDHTSYLVSLDTLF